MTGSLECGDLAPNFLLPNREGKMGRFYDRFLGNWVILYFCRSSADSRIRKELRNLNRKCKEFDALNAKIVVVTLDSYETNATYLSDRGIELDIFSDPVGAITSGYAGKKIDPDNSTTDGVSHDGFYQSTFIVDPNQRIAATICEKAGQVEQTLKSLKNFVHNFQSDQNFRQAPVLMLPDLLSPELCQQLVRDWHHEHYEGLITIGRGFSDEADTVAVAASVKMRRDHRLMNDTNIQVSDIVGRRVAPMLQKVFQFQLGSMQHFRIGAYSAERGDFFKPHRDNDTPTTENRRFAMSVNLNSDYQGGELWFPEFSRKLYKPPIGGGIIFSCSLLHEAMPVTCGTRFVALTFFFSIHETNQQKLKKLPGLGG